MRASELSEPPAGSFRAALRCHEFRRLIDVYAMGAVGQTFGTVAMTVAMFDQTGSPAWVGAIASARLLPYVLFSGFAGVFADHVSRRTVLFVSSAARVVLAALLAACVALDAPPLALVILAFAFTTAGTPCYPAMAAALPTVLPATDLAAGNGLLTAVETLSFVVGPAMGGAVLLLGPPELALAANAVIFAVAILLMRGLEHAPAPYEPHPDESLGERLTAGVRAITSSGDVAAPLLLVVVVNLVYGGSLVGLVFVAEDLLDSGKSGFGVLSAGLGIGAFVGVGLTNMLSRLRRPLGVLAVTTLLTGVPFAALALVSSPVVAAGLMVLSGVGSVATEIIAVTMVQRAVTGAVIARVFGVLDALIVGAVFVGTIITPPIIDAIGLRPSLVLVGVVVPGSAVLVASRLHGIATRSRSVEESLEPRVALLAAVPWLSGAIRPALEGLAAYSREEDVAPGGVVIAEGDEPDDFFVVVSGAVEVRRRGANHTEQSLTVLGPGAGFGEIGLLQQVPRTASVVAIEASRILRVHGERFVATVNAVSSSAGGTLAGGLFARMGAGGTDH